MRISDWSSDVCSSDLRAAIGAERPLVAPPARSDHRHGKGLDAHSPARAAEQYRIAARHLRPRRLARTDRDHCRDQPGRSVGDARPRGSAGPLVRPQADTRAGACAHRPRGRGRLMKAFADLLERLVYTRSRNSKLELIARYLKATPDPDRGWALAALTGELSIPAVPPSILRALVEQRVEPVLFE